MGRNGDGAEEGTEGVSRAHTQEGGREPGTGALAGTEEGTSKFTDPAGRLCSWLCVGVRVRCRQPWWVAAKKGDDKQLKELLESGRDPNAVDDKNRTALFFAAGFGHEKVGRSLAGTCLSSFLFFVRCAISQAN